MTPHGLESSAYDQFKTFIVSIMPFERNDLHFVIGATILFVFLLVPRWQKSTRAAIVMLLSTLALGVVMEMLDLYDDYRFRGYLRWSTSALDVLRTAFVPLVYVASQVIVRLRQGWPRPSLAESKKSAKLHSGDD